MKNNFLSGIIGAALFLVALVTVSTIRAEKQFPAGSVCAQLDFKQDVQPDEIALLLQSLRGPLVKTIVIPAAEWAKLPDAVKRHLLVVECEAQ